MKLETAMAFVLGMGIGVCAMGVSADRLQEERLAEAMRLISVCESKGGAVVVSSQGEPQCKGMNIYRRAM